MKRKSRALLAVGCAAGLAVPLLPTATSGDQAAASTTVQDRAGSARTDTPFRVLPYLQKPASDEMSVRWVTESNAPGVLKVRGPGLRGPRALPSEPVHQPLLNYTDAERDQDIPGLDQGSWLKGDDNYMHAVTIEGLRPGKQYRYEVVQDGKVFRGKFRTAPESDKWDEVRIVAFSDTETEPRGRVEKREWELSPVAGYADGSAPRPSEGSLWDEKHGSTTRYGEFTLRYPMDQDQAMRENMRWIEEADPDLFLIAGDLVQGGGYQPAWDEFFGYVAGEHGRIASRTPMVTALGNWETYAAISGGYGTPEDRSPVVRSRNKYHAYFDGFGDDANPQFKNSYHRVDHGPVTVLTIDSTNGLPDEDVRTGTLSNPIFSGDDTNLDPDKLSTDTQGSFLADEYAAAYPSVFPGSSPEESDLPAFNPGTAQWQWVEQQLADARAAGQIVLVQFHHAAYSNGVHGTPPNHEHADNQSGVAMRAYTPMFEEYGVAAVISGHDEMFERSWVDDDGDGQGFHSYDVGVAADGLRGEQLYQTGDGTWEPIRFNTRSEWMAAIDEPEMWVDDANGRPQLQDGGLHYGHLQIDVKRTACGADLTMNPVYVFPIMDDNYNVVDTERRVYDDVVDAAVDRDGVPTDQSCGS
jgi:hypothetical protein